MRFPYGTNVMVTGASSGIGLASAVMLAQKGYRVWGTSRSGQPVDGAVRMHAMDVTDEDSVAHAVGAMWDEAVRLTGDGIGIAVHCAGMGIAGAAEDTPVEDVMLQMQTNYVGVLQVNRHMLARMRQRGPSLVIVTTSVAGRISIPFQSHYSSSKYALEAYVEALRIEGKPFGIKAVAVEPGDTRTAFTKRRSTCIPPGSPYTVQARASIAKMEHDETNGAPPEKTARVIVRMTTRKRPPIRIAVDLQYKLLLFIKRFLPECLVEWVVGLLYAPTVR